MQNRHTAQIRELLHKKNLSKSRFNPESRIVSHNSPLKQSRPIKRSESSTSLQQKNIELQCIQQRYRDLHESYLQIAQETKKKIQLCKKHEEQIQKYQKARERDKKQIQRLRTMLGFIQKVDKQTQTSAQQTYPQYSYQSCSYLGEKSPYKKQRQRTPLQNKSQLINKNSRINQRSSSATKNSRIKNNQISHSNSQYLQKMKKLSSGHQLIKSQKSIKFGGDLGLRESQSRIKSPLNKYKFIPSLQFQ